MGRLTFKRFNENCIPITDAYGDVNFDNRNTAGNSTVLCGKVVDKLSAYEDTGLTPKEIKALQEDNEKLHKLIDEIEETILHEKVNK